MKSKLTLEKSLRLVLVLLFALFLFLPLIQILLQATFVEGRMTFSLIANLVQNSKWQGAFVNSLFFSVVTASLATILGFFLAYGMNFTNVPSGLKHVTNQLIIFPMLLPTITYGFVLVYSFGKQGLWSRLLHGEFVSIYGSNGVVLGLLIYSLPVTFILMNDAMRYIDKRYLIVSRLLKDNFWQGVKLSVLKPLTKVFGVAFVQSFFMSFTDFGIPVAVGGKKVFITTLLYDYFMGALPDFSQGSVVALTMLLPSVISICLLKYLQKKEVFYDQQTHVALRKNYARDVCFGSLLITVSLFFCSVFLIMFLIPFVKLWPYDLGLTQENFKRFFEDSNLLLTIKNGLLVAFLTTICGTMLAYLAAVFTARSRKNNRLIQLIDSFSAVTNSVPGMVLGIAYLLSFSGTLIHNTFAILVLANIIHYFATPYQMAKSALQKMNPHWENTAKIMGDRWQDTLRRVIIPNSKITILEMFSYYFTNAMVTISAVVFLTSANTVVITTKIKELQHFGQFTDIFILSLILLVINLTVRLVIQFMIRRMQVNEKKKVKCHQKLCAGGDNAPLGSL